MIQTHSQIPQKLNCPTIQSIYTDGACSGNPGPGGWGTVIYFADGSVHELGGSEPQTTNNRMEMQAAIAALEFLQACQQTASVALYTDSEYVKNGITRWLTAWKKKGWKTSQGKAVLNQDLWQILDHLNSALIDWRYVRGHAGNVGNERCDAIARAFSQGRSIRLQQQSFSQANSKTNSEINADAKHPVVSTSPEVPSLAIKTDPPSNNALNLSTNVGINIDISDGNVNGDVQSFVKDRKVLASDFVTMESTVANTLDALDELPREIRVTQLRHLIETLRLADELARKGYFITSSELADLMDVNASAVTSRGDHWVWRNWVVSRVRREGNQILWQLERVDQID